MHPILNNAIKAARKAGDVLVRSMERFESVNLNDKARKAFVKEIETMAEAAILAVLQESYPNDHFIAKYNQITPETTTHETNTTWYIDALGGTVNYLHGLPHYGVSIALVIDKKIEHGVIYNPILQELFTASRGGGAFLNDRRIRVSLRKKLDNALIGTGFPIHNLAHLKPYLSTFAAIFPKTAGVRRAGSSALDLAYVANGRLDGFWDIDLKPWEMAAGILLVKEAGGLVTDFHAEETYLDSGNIVAANPKLLKATLQIIQPSLQAEG